MPIEDAACFCHVWSVAMASEPAEREEQDERVFSGPILGLTIVGLIFFSAHFMYFPTLPFFIVELGGRESEIGLLFAVSLFTSVVVRPFVGRGLDTRGRKPLLLLGLALYLVNSLLHNIVTAPIGLFPLRLLTGAALSTTMTAASTYIADLAPERRRGEVVGYFALAQALGIAIGPVLGGYVIQSSLLASFDDFFTDRWTWLSGAQTGDYQFTSLFLLAVVMGLVAFALALRLPETKPVTQDETPRKFRMTDMIVKEAVFPATISFVAAFSFAGMVTFLPLFAADLGLENSGYLFIVYAILVTVMRFTVGRHIDKVSRAVVIIPGIFALAGTMFLLAGAQNVPMLFIAVGLWGIGMGIFQPAMMAFTIDRSPPEARGQAMSTFTIGNDMGISAGSLVLGLTADFGDFRSAFLVAGLVVASGLVLFTIVARRSRNAVTQPTPA